MIEQGIYFALGCIVTALAALMFAPVFWRRALLLSQQRLQLQIPLSMQEIFAERDQLRAEFAVERLRVEQDLERVQAGKASDMAEIGRRSMDASRWADQVAELRRAEQARDTELGTLTRDLSERESRIASLTADLQSAQDALGRLRKDGSAAAREASASRAMSVELQASQAKMAAEIEGLRDELESAHRLAARLEQDAIVGSREAAATRMATAEQAQAGKAQVSLLEKDLAAAVAALAEARDREKSHHLRSSMQAEKGRSDERAVAARFDALQAENEALQAARRTSSVNLGAANPGATDPGSSPGPTHPSAGSDGGLRESIHALGLAVAAMTRESRRPVPNDATSKNEVQPVA